MKDKVIIFGVNMFSAVVLQSILKENKAEVLGFTLNREFITFDSFEGYPVVPFEELDSKIDMMDVKIAVTIGYSNMNANRAAVYSKCKDKSYNIYTFISDDAYVMTESIGEGSIILPKSYIGPYVKIGRSVIVWPFTQICHHNNIGDFTYIAPNAIIGGGTSIGSFCFIGLGCTVINDLSVSNKTLFGAGCCMNKNSEVENSAYVGNPARCLNQKADEVIQKVK